MKKMTTIGLDLAKHVFHVICCNEYGKVVKKKKLQRGEVVSFFTQTDPCLIGMEGCSGAHYWARQLVAGASGEAHSSTECKAFCSGEQERL